MRSERLYTFIYLQGSQTVIESVSNNGSFTPLFTYKVLKPKSERVQLEVGFTPLFTYKVLKPSVSLPISVALLYTFIYLQGSQTKREWIRCRTGFTPLFTYKVLKPTYVATNDNVCFTPLFTYKVLKQL